jgi:hypothetical protein
MPCKYMKYPRFFPYITAYLHHHFLSTRHNSTPSKGNGFFFFFLFFDSHNRIRCTTCSGFHGELLCSSTLYTFLLEKLPQGLDHHEIRCSICDFIKALRLGASLLRLHFHDCFVNVNFSLCLSTYPVVVCN